MKERKPKLILFSCKYFFAILIAIGINASLEAQNIDYDLGCPNATSILANQLPGSAITFAPFTAINGGAITIEITDISVSGLGSVPGPYTSPFLLNSGALLTTDITFTITGGTTVSLSTPASGINPLAAGKTITFSLTANGPEGPCLKTYSFKVITPASLMLVLDVSAG